MTELDDIKAALDSMPNLVGTPDTNAYARSNERAAQWYDHNFRTICEALSHYARYLELKDTHVMVPREPTQEMIEAAYNACGDFAVVPCRAYEGMLSASVDPFGGR
jgi:hypothetical protein